MAKNLNNKVICLFKLLKFKKARYHHFLFAALLPIYGHSVVFEIFETRICKKEKMAISWFTFLKFSVNLLRLTEKENSSMSVKKIFKYQIYHE